MTGTGPTAAERNRLLARTAPMTERASAWMLWMESDIWYLLEPASGPSRSHAKEVAGAVPNVESGLNSPFSARQCLNARFTDPNSRDFPPRIGVRIRPLRSPIGRGTRSFLFAAA